MQAENIANKTRNKRESNEKGGRQRYQLVVTRVNPSLSALYLHLSTHLSTTNKATKNITHRLRAALFLDLDS